MKCLGLKPYVNSYVFLIFIHTVLDHIDEVRKKREDLYNLEWHLDHRIMGFASSSFFLFECFIIWSLLICVNKAIV